MRTVKINRKPRSYITSYWNLISRDRYASKTPNELTLLLPSRFRHENGRARNLEEQQVQESDRHKVTYTIMRTQSLETSSYSE